jgi:hypothetical protein
MQHLKDFTKTFETLCYGHNKGSVFADFVEIAALTTHQAAYHAGVLPKDETFERIEQSYLDAIKRYDKAEIEQIVMLYATASMGVMENRADFLGAAYMNLEISNDRSGQFFTPPAVSRMMAEIAFTGMEDHIKEKGYVTVDEPAVGAGGMLIEAANAIQRLGFDPRMTMYFRATDIDRTCFNMAYFQLSMLDLSGEVVHGNTLSLEAWDRRLTPQMLMVQAGLAPSREAEISPPPVSAHEPAKQPEPVKSATTLGPQIEMDFGPQPEKTHDRLPSPSEVIDNPKAWLPDSGHGNGEQGHDNGPQRGR